MQAEPDINTVAICLSVHGERGRLAERGCFLARAVSWPVSLVLHFVMLAGGDAFVKSRQAVSHIKVSLGRIKSQLVCKSFLLFARASSPPR